MAVAAQGILGSAKNSAKLGERHATLVGEVTTLRLLAEEGSLLHQGGTQLLNPLSRVHNQLPRLPPMPFALSTPLQQPQSSPVLITTLSLTLPQNTGGRVQVLKFQSYLLILNAVRLLAQVC